MRRVMRGAKNISKPNNTVTAALSQASHSPFVVGHGSANSMISPSLIPRGILLRWRQKENRDGPRIFGSVAEELRADHLPKLANSAIFVP
jgi:hypothetical protein